MPIINSQGVAPIYKRRAQAQKERVEVPAQREIRVAGLSDLVLFGGLSPRLMVLAFALALGAKLGGHSRR